MSRNLAVVQPKEWFNFALVHTPADQALGADRLLYLA